jgi:hypothetical protein
MPTKISNTNTNINKININVPRARNAKVTPKSVKKAEQDLQTLETQDREIPYISQAPSQFINPSVFGFNTTPIQEPIQEPVQTRTAQTQTQQRPGRSMATSTRNMETGIGTDTEDLSPVEAEAIPFRSAGIPVDKGSLSPFPEYRLNIPSDFQSRLSRQEGFQPTTSYAPLVSNRMRDIQKQGRPDINEMARNLISLRPENQELVIVDEFGERMGTLSGPSTVQQKVKSIEQRQPTPVFPKAAGKQAGGVYEQTGDEGAYVERTGKPKGRPKGSKNKPKPKTVETQVGPSLEEQQMEVVRVPRPKTALRG